MDMSGERTPAVSLVIPVYNEECALPTTIPLLLSWLDAANEPREVLFSDDGSTDESAALLDQAAQADARIRVLHAASNAGKGAAVRRGMLEASGALVIFTDCDLAYGLDAVRRVREKLLQTGADAVLGSRALHPAGYGYYSAARKLMSRAYRSYLRRSVRLHFSDSQCGIKGFRREAAHAVFSRCETDGFAFDLEVLLLASQLSLRVVEIPVNILRHSEERSSVHPLRDAVKMVGQVRKIRRRHKKKQDEARDS